MSKWRERLDRLKPEDALGTEIVEYPSGSVLHYLFACDVCGKGLRIRKKHLPYVTGRCKKHAQLHRPYEAVYGAILRSARERGIPVELSYDEYVEFTGRACHYCDGSIPWEPYNEHGKSSPGWFLDRRDPCLGYSVSNCVACCTRCNMAKRSLTEPDFVSLCLAVAAKQRHKP